MPPLTDEEISAAEHYYFKKAADKVPPKKFEPIKIELKWIQISKFPSAVAISINSSAPDEVLVISIMLDPSFESCIS